MDTPDDWTPEHLVAALLVGMSMIDGDVDSSEMKALIGSLRGFPGVESSGAGAIGRAAYAHLHAVEEGGGNIVATLRELGGELGMHYDEPVLRSILERLTDMAAADGEIHPMEARLLQAFKLGWEL